MFDVRVVYMDGSTTRVAKVREVTVEEGLLSFEGEGGRTICMIPVRNVKRVDFEYA